MPGLEMESHADEIDTFHFCKDALFMGFFWYLTYSFYMWLAMFFSINQNVVLIYYKTDIKLFNKDPVNVVFNAS